MNNKNQIIFGFFLGFAFSILGLYAGLLFPEQSKERLTFIDGWKKGALFNIAIICVIIIAIVTTIK